MTFSEAREKYRGQVVIFTKSAEDLECYPEEGMKGRVLEMRQEHDGEVINVLFDFSEFDEHNMAIESRCYYDKHNQPILTAREAGCYFAQDLIYFDGTKGCEWTEFHLEADVFAYLERHPHGEHLIAKPGYQVMYLDLVVVSLSPRYDEGYDAHTQSFSIPNIDLKYIQVYKTTRVI